MSRLKQFRQLLLATPEWLSESFRHAEVRGAEAPARIRAGAPARARPKGRKVHT